MTTPAAGPSNPLRRGLVRQSGLSTVFSFAAVVSGLVLDASIASRFGAGRTTDVLYVALRIPVGLGVVAMSAATQALVPTFSRWLATKESGQGLRLVSAVFTSVILSTALVAALGAILSWSLMRLTAPGISAHDINLAASLSRILFLIVPLLFGAEVLRALLNSQYIFSAPAGMNVVMNGTAAALVLGLHSDRIQTVAWAYVAGAAMQLLFMAIVTIMHGLRFNPALPDRKDPELRQAGARSVRPLAAAGLNPLARVGEQLLVSFLPPGSITLLNYGNRLISAIGGPAFRSVVVTLMPRLSSARARGNDEDEKSLTLAGMRIVLAVSVPLTMLLAVLGEPAARIVFRRGNFTRDDTVLLGVLLSVYAGSLIGSGVQRVLLTPFFSRFDTRTPLRNTVYGVVANLALIPVLMAVLPWRGQRQVITVAIAYSLAQYVNVGHAWYRLRADADISFYALRRYFATLTGATCIATGLMLAASHILRLSGHLSRLALFARTTAVGVLGVVAIVGIMAILPNSELRASLQRLRRSGAPLSP